MSEELRAWINEVRVRDVVVDDLAIRVDRPMRREGVQVGRCRLVPRDRRSRRPSICPLFGCLYCLRRRGSAGAMRLFEPSWRAVDRNSSRKWESLVPLNR
jgi:hypothetical protein